MQISENPAYKLVTILYKSNNPKEAAIKQSTASISGTADYEELYFKHTIENDNSTGEGDYEPIECRL